MPTQSGPASFVCQISLLWRSTFSSSRAVVQRHLSRITGISSGLWSLRTWFAWTASYTWQVLHFIHPRMARPNAWSAFSRRSCGVPWERKWKRKTRLPRTLFVIPQHAELRHGEYSGWADDLTTSKNSALSSTTIRTLLQETAAALHCVRDREPCLRSELRCRSKSKVVTGANYVIDRYLHVYCAVCRWHRPTSSSLRPCKYETVGNNCAVWLITQIFWVCQCSNVNSIELILLNTNNNCMYTHIDYISIHKR